MSRNWNGLDLQSEFSEILQDTSASFKTNVLRWINDIQDDICARYDWNFMLVKGKRILTASEEFQTLTIEPPSAPTVSLSVGGSLIESSTYQVLVTFYEGVAGVESIAGVASAVMTPTALNKTIDVSVIPVSTTSPLVTARKLYLSKDSGAYYYHSTISDNTTTTATISSDTSSTIEAPDYSYLKKLNGNAFLEGTSSTWLNHYPIDQLRLMYRGTWSTGTPAYWSELSTDKITTYPIPNSAYTLSFYYFKLPAMIYATEDSSPTIPIWLKPTLKAGVIALGYEYRDRDKYAEKLQHYELLIKEMISKMGQGRKGPSKVRDVVGTSDGYYLD